MEDQKHYYKDLSPFYFDKENLEINFKVIRYDIVEKEKIKLELQEYESWNVFNPNLYDKK